MGSPTLSSVRELAHCRICGSTALRGVYSLGSLRSCGLFPAAQEPDPPEISLRLVRCSQCSLVQLDSEFVMEDLFGNRYGYRSGINESMVRHLHSITARIAEQVPLQAGDVVLDIGSNDGTLLNSYSTPGLVRVGMDPTTAAFGEFYQPGIVKLASFFSAEGLQSVASGPARVITSIAMFYDLPDPNAFVADIARCLAPDGIWVLEMSYLPAMIATGSFDTICPEHLEYYRLATVKFLLERHGLRIQDVFLNDVNGGSFQIWAGHVGAAKSADEKIGALLDAEARDGYADGDLPFVKLRAQVEESRAQVLAFLTQARAQGKLVHGYGASTKGNTLLQHFGITREHIPAIADRNPSKAGCRTPGTGIPIVTEEESRRQRPDYYFVLPWHFRDGFLQREQAFLESGGSLVFPLPKFEIVSAETLGR